MEGLKPGQPAIYRLQFPRRISMMTDPASAITRFDFRLEFVFLHCSDFLTAWPWSLGIKTLSLRATQAITPGLSTTLTLLDYGRVARDSPKISGSAIEFPFPRWRRRFGCFSERVLLGPRNPSSSQNVRTRCRRAFVRQTSTALDRTAWTGVR
jgi:hypothetical protein